MLNIIDFDVGLNLVIGISIFVLLTLFCCGSDKQTGGLNSIQCYSELCNEMDSEYEKSPNSAATDTETTETSSSSTNSSNYSKSSNSSSGLESDDSDNSSDNISTRSFQDSTGTLSDNFRPIDDNNDY